MTPLLFGIALVAEVLLVWGQFLVKRAMVLTNGPRVPKGRFAVMFGSAIVALSGYFFLWLGLMQNRGLRLSQQYAFDALAPVMLVLVAVIFFEERLTLRGWVGVGLISGGLVMISMG
jgi:drug/metabolite transporter (DMT)-like permease